MRNAALLGIVAALAAPAATEVVLVADGEARCALVLPSESHADEELAAEEIRAHIEKMSGAGLTAASDGTATDLIPVRIGWALAPAEARTKLQAHSGDPGAFILSVQPDGVTLAGNSPEGTLFAAYELLEQLGCRWYLPGELGTVIPRTKTVVLPIGDTFQAPSFAHRHLITVSGAFPWYRRQRLGGLRLPPCHGVPQLPRTTFEEDPDLFALIDGERRDTQLCTTHPEVLKRAVAATLDYFRNRPELPWIGMGPDDNARFCECDTCVNLDTGEVDPVSSKPIRTDRWIRFFKQVLEGVHQEFPGKKICFYAYDSCKLPPRNVEMTPHLVPAFAPIQHCRIHGMSNPICPDRSMYRGLIEAWRALVPEVFERGYYFNLACPGFPFSKIHAVRDETVLAHQLGMTGWDVECMPSWASHGPTLYVACRLFWDAGADVDVVLADFAERFFGPAAGPMLEYLYLVDTAYRDTDVHVGSSFCMPRVFTKERMLRGKALLDEAAGQAAYDDVLSQRVRIFRLNYDQLEAFLQMREQRNSHDFAAAQASLDRLRSVIQEMLDFRLYPSEPPEEPFSDYDSGRDVREARLLWPRAGRSYLSRFWTRPVESGYERTAGRGELVAPLPDEWDFLIDPTEVGEALRWYRDGAIGGNWRKLKTASATWSEQGLHYYKGLAWYRAHAQIPARFRGRKVFLWFGGVDERADVWLNGTRLGHSDDPGKGLPGAGGTFRPFEFDATGAVRFGESNTVAVKITNKEQNEVGTGGITAPVMFWSPRNE